MSDCSNHRKDIAGITDMIQLAEMIGDLHYEALQELFFNLSRKLYEDSVKDAEGGRLRLSVSLDHASDHIANASYCMAVAWKISEPHMMPNEPNDKWSVATEDASSTKAGKQIKGGN